MICMNAYTLVGSTNRYPCAFCCFANASACGVYLGAGTWGFVTRCSPLDVIPCAATPFRNHGVELIQILEAGLELADQR